MSPRGPPPALHPGNSLRGELGPSQLTSPPLFPTSWGPLSFLSLMSSILIPIIWFWFGILVLVFGLLSFWMS